ncbi:phosphatidylglycerol lysyltransferase domain-containing protein [Henriciella sp.]|uniref:phosphatidylglycerol lysyltransferase domain-containing protein n=1 Tax=Henriciella sp. TaxID=1968823 RepID=UPI0017F7D7AE|nr:phosphatidylglycerol lysyltransferase domain-containing protein [Henriciella sp.]HIG20951.1 bifunctional lysylphosphatidylglycerol flippase/synthetase MprF [Henriciella sp.]
MGAELVFLFAPFVFAGVTALAGLVVLAALMIPGQISRVPFDLPLPLIEASHFISSVVGTALLILSLGIRQRLHSAWLMAVAAFIILAALSLTAGRDTLLAIALGVAALCLFAARFAFYRSGALSRIWLSPQRFSILLIILLGIAWLGFFAYRNVAYRNELWWTFALDADVSRFLRALVVMSVTAVLFFFWRLLQPPAAPRLPERTPELEAQIAAVVTSEETPQAEAALAWLPDKRFEFSEDGRGFIMYGVRGRSWIAKGPPMGPRDMVRPLAFALKRKADRANANLIFYAVPTDFLPVALDLGLVARKIGEAAVIPLSTFSLEGPSRAKLRHALNRLNREGGRFEVLPAGSFKAHEAELRRVSDAWLHHHAGEEKAFTLGCFDPDYLDRFPIAAIWHGETLWAFANIWRSGDGKALAIDLMRVSPDAPPTAMDALFAELAMWGKGQGAVSLDLGMAPLSGLASEREANSLARLGNFIYAHGGEMYGFEGLRRYKEKFQPDWNPLYLCGPERQNLAFALADVALLSSGGLRGILKRPSSR